jgi:hypothetical protein
MAAGLFIIGAFALAYIGFPLAMVWLVGTLLEAGQNWLNEPAEGGTDEFMAWSDQYRSGRARREMAMLGKRPC